MIMNNAPGAPVPHRRPLARAGGERGGGHQGEPLV